jgi:hypothetical protein
MTLARILPVVLVLAACDGNGSVTDTSTDTPADTTVDSPSDVSEDEPCVVDAPCMSSTATCFTGGCGAGPWVSTCIGGSVRDETGATLACQSVVACTEGSCYFGRSDESGFFTVTLPGTAIPDLSVYFPVAGRLHHSPFCRFTDLCDGELNMCGTDFVLYSAPTSGTPVPTGALASDIRVEASDTAAVVIPAGSEVHLPFYFFEHGDWVALTRFPLSEHVPCFLDPAHLPLALYVFTPFDTYIIEPGTVADPVHINAGLDLPNETGLSPGTAVDIYVVGGMYGHDIDILEGEWTRLAGATVSTDGTRIQTAAGDGIPYLSWFGIYEAP